MIRYIPSALTACNLICGFSAIVLGDLKWGPILLLFSFLFDSIDGLAARALNATSEFGKQMDSLADIVSFGVAPAYLYSLCSPDQENKLYTIAACSLIVVGGMIRLAKFNITESKPYFQGLPIPANALFYIGLFFSINTGNETLINLTDSPIIYFLIPVVLSGFMVSFGLKMFSTKGMSKFPKDNIFHYIMAVVAVILFMIFRIDAVAYIVVAYIILSIGHTFTYKN